MSKKSIFLFIVIIFTVGTTFFYFKKVYPFSPIETFYIYENDLYHYRINYPKNTTILAPSLDERTLLEQGQLNTNNLKIVQFYAKNLTYTISSTENPNNKTLKTFLREKCDEAKKHGDSCGAVDPIYEEYLMPDRTNALIESYQWNGLIVKLLHYPLDRKFLTVAFTSISINDRESLKLIDRIVNSFQKI